LYDFTADKAEKGFRQKNLGHPIRQRLSSKLPTQAASVAPTEHTDDNRRGDVAKFRVTRTKMFV